MEKPCVNFNVIETLNVSDIADLWVQLKDAAKTDEEVRTFLVTFEPWAKDKLQRHRH